MPFILLSIYLKISNYMDRTVHDSKVLTQSAYIPTCFDGGYFSESAEKYIFRYLCKNVSVRSRRLERHHDWRDPFYSSIERHVDVITSSRFNWNVCS
jgi:hypothetical protein